MSEFRANGSHPFSFDSSMPPDVGIELRMHMEELDAARQRSLDHTKSFRNNVGLPDITDSPQLVGEFVQVLYGIDRFDSSVITQTELADLCAINEHATAVLVPQTEYFAPQYKALLENKNWTNEPIDNIGQDLEYVEGIREVISWISPKKARTVNMMRFAARVWLDRFDKPQQSAAAFGAAVIFGELFKATKDRVESQASCVDTPEDAYIALHDGYEAMSPYCFAAVPMRRDEAREYSVMSRRAF